MRTKVLLVSAKSSDRLGMKWQVVLIRPWILWSSLSRLSSLCILGSLVGCGYLRVTQQSLDQASVSDTQAPQILSVNPSSLDSLNGGLITIQGAHFNQGMVIKIGGALCSNPQVLNSETVTCMAPPFTPAVLDVVITKPSGVASSLPSSISYTGSLPVGPICGNNSISSIASDGNQLYLGGSFTSLGTCSGSLMALDSITGIQNKNPLVPIVDGRLKSVISDGQGGYFLGGQFSKVNGEPRSNIAYIHSDGTLDPRIGATIAVPSPYSFSFVSVDTLAYDSLNSTLYLGGNFQVLSTTANSQLKTSVHFFDAFTLQPSPQQVSLIGNIEVSISDGAGGFYVAGPIQYIDGVAIGGLAHITSAHQLDPLFLPTINGNVTSLKLDGNTLYVAGEFTTINGITRNNIASFDLTTKSLTSWNPSITCVASSSCGVRGMELNSATQRIYVQGNFNRVGGQTRNNLVEISTTTGVPTAWARIIGGGGISNMLLDGSILYLAGSFTSIDGQPRVGLAAYDLNAGALTSFNPSLTTTFGFPWPRKVMIHNGKLYVIGDFDKVNGVDHPNTAAISLADGSLTTALPQSDLGGAIGLNVFHHDSKIFVTGYGLYNNAPDIVGFDDAGNRVALPLNIFESGSQLDATVSGSSFMVYSPSGSVLVGGVARNGLAAINIATGALTSFAPSLDSSVLSLLVKDQYLYLGGFFNSIDSQVRNGFAVWDLSTNQLSSQGASLFNSSSYVTSFLPYNDKLFIGGSFENSSAPHCKNLCQIQRNTGDFVASFEPNVLGTILTLSSHGETLYLGGSITSVNGVPRTHIAALDVASGALQSWAPNISGSSVSSIHIDSTTNSVYLGGVFQKVGSVDRTNLAKIDATSAEVLPWNPSVNDSVVQIFSVGSNIVIGGAFNFYNKVVRKGLASLDLSSGRLSSFAPLVIGSVNALKIHNSVLYVGGSFTSINGVARSRLASVDIPTETLSAWDPAPNNTVSVMEVSDGRLLVGGAFTTISSQSRRALASYDLTSGPTLSSWNPNPDVADITKIKIDQGGLNKIYIVGNFNTFDGQQTPKVAALNKSNLMIDNINFVKLSTFGANTQPRALLSLGAKVYVAGIEFMGGVPRSNIAELDSGTGAATSWNPGLSGTVYEILSQGQYLYFLGWIETLGGAAVSSLCAYDVGVGGLRAWNPQIRGSFWGGYLEGADLYIFGSFVPPDGLPRALTKISTTSGAVMPGW